MDDSTPLARLRHRLALPLGENAVFDGWTAKAVESTAEQMGIDIAQAKLAAPGNAAAMVDMYIAGVDRELEAWAESADLEQMKIRERIRALVWKRLEIMGPAREAVRTGLSILAMPHNLPLAARRSWQSADLMWRLAGDTSTDFNHYTKRMTLGAVYASTTLAWLDDQSENWAETAGFLDRRIDDVMAFERLKAKWRNSSGRQLSLTRFLGRLRYPPR